MKIKRNVNGQEMEFELTRAEIYDAFCEQEREHYKEDIKSISKGEMIAVGNVKSVSLGE